MKIRLKVLFLLLACVALFSSCTTLNQASRHGFNEGYYKLISGDAVQKVYADPTEEKIDFYKVTNKNPDSTPYLTVPLYQKDSSLFSKTTLRKQSLDIDITSVLLKYRPSVNGLQSQLTSDLNLALYAGWRHDSYKLKASTTPLSKRYLAINNWGYDFGLFAGIGPTTVNSFSTNNLISNEYNGMIFQGGAAGFLESSFASFGLAVGFDQLLNRDRKIWIYNNQLWIGFIVGIAIN